MKYPGWKDTVELVGIAAIVASLVFVGLQMKQSQQIAIADQYQSRAAAALEWYMTRMESDKLLSTTADWISNQDTAADPVTVRLDSSAYNPESLAIRYLSYRANFTLFDNYHFQYEQGFMTDDAWNAFRVRLKATIADKVTAEMFRQQADQWRKGFSDLCFDVLGELEAEHQSRQ